MIFVQKYVVLDEKRELDEKEEGARERNEDKFPTTDSL